MWPGHVTSWKGPASRRSPSRAGPAGSRRARGRVRRARGRGRDPGVLSGNRCRAPPDAGPQARGPRSRFSQPRRRCQGDRRRRFPRRAPPPGQSDRRSPEPRFSLFRSHFRPRTGGSAASAEGPSAGGLWDGVGPGRWREGAWPGRRGGSGRASSDPPPCRGDGARLPALLDPARPFGARRRRRGSKPNSCRPGRPAGPGRGGWRPRGGGRAAAGAGWCGACQAASCEGPRSPVFVPELTHLGFCSRLPRGPAGLATCLHRFNVCNYGFCFGLWGLHVCPCPVRTRHGERPPRHRPATTIKLVLERLSSS